MTIDTRALSDFNSLVLEGHGDLVLVRGDTPSVTIDTDPETLEHLKVEVANGRLTLGMKSWLDYLLHGWKPIHYQVTFRELNAVAISGSSKVRAETIEADRFEFRISGSSSLRVEKLTVNDLQVHISGSGETVKRYGSPPGYPHQRQRQVGRLGAGQPDRRCAHQRFGRFDPQSQREAECLDQRQRDGPLPGQPADFTIDLRQRLDPPGKLKSIAVL